MNALTQFQNFGPISSAFAGQNFDDDLAAGVTSGFGVVSCRGKVWRIKHRGEERDLMREDGDGPRASIEVVIVKASNVVSKVFYENGYTDGTNAAPDCSSANGLTPDAGSPKRQCNTCAACPKNAWGSRITESGKQGKACVDAKRLAIVPLGDLRNEAFGGPMLLRVPAASLADMATYGKTLGQLNYPVCAVGTRIAFDVKEAFPKFVFNAIRPLSDAEAHVILELRADPQVERILNEEMAEAAPVAPAAPAAQSVFEQPPAAAPQQAGVPFGGPSGQVVSSAPVAAATAPSMTASAPHVAPGASPAPNAGTSTAGSGFGQVAPQPAPQPVQQASTGFGGFGPAPTQAAPQPAPQPVQQFVQPTPQPVTQQVTEAATGSGSFDDALEAEMAKLMAPRG